MERQAQQVNAKESVTDLIVKEVANAMAVLVGHHEQEKVAEKEEEIAKCDKFLEKQIESLTTEKRKLEEAEQKLEEGEEKLRWETADMQKDRRGLKEERMQQNKDSALLSIREKLLGEEENYCPNNTYQQLPLLSTLESNKNKTKKRKIKIPLK